MPPRKTTIRYEVRQRFLDVVVVRRSLIRRAGVSRTVEDVIGRYGDTAAAQTVANIMNDLRSQEI